MWKTSKVFIESVENENRRIINKLMAGRPKN